MKSFLLSALAACIATTALAADLPTPPPSDWLKQAELFGAVAAAKPDEPVIAWERDNQALLSSGFLFDLSRRLLPRDPDQALEWYAIALIRGHYDAGRCLDDTARRAVSRLSGMAEEVARYGHTHPHDFGAAGLRALARPDLLTHTISPDWVCAQGLSGMGARSAGTTPPSAWPAVEQRLRRDYTKQFEAMAKR
ncbi:MAG: hypothetical protein H7Y60_15615 [Rhodospirillaceae bacterium]|nr:hypothetical protein [Rhodospirillales bacterium]